MIRGLLVAAAFAAAAIGGALMVSTEAMQSLAPATFTADCGDGYYWSKTAGSCVPVPTQASTPPPGSTYQCADGTFSSSPTSTGACSRHDGIDHPV